MPYYKNIINSQKTCFDNEIENLRQNLSKFSSDYEHEEIDKIINTSLQKLLTADDPNIQKNLLNLFTEYNFDGSDDLVDKIIRSLHNHFSYTKDFIYDPTADLEDRDVPFLTKFGFEKIFNYYEKKYSLENNSFLAIELKDLKAYLEKIQNGIEDKIQGIIIYDATLNYSGFFEDPHIVPLFIMKKERDLNILITDSIGEDIEEKHISQALKSIVNESVNLSSKINVFSYCIKRQHSSFSCSIFSISDLKNLFKELKKANNPFEFLKFNSNPVNVTDKIFKLLNVKRDNINIFEIAILPPSLNKVTQSYKQIDEYRAHSPTMRQNSPVGEKLFSMDDIDELCKSLEQHSYFKSHKRNGYVDHKKAKFFHILFSQS